MTHPGHSLCKNIRSVIATSATNGAVLPWVGQGSPRSEAEWGSEEAISTCG
jgi:hypothetical protein